MDFTEIEGISKKMSEALMKVQPITEFINLEKLHKTVPRRLIYDTVMFFCRKVRFKVVVYGEKL